MSGGKSGSNRKDTILQTVQTLEEWLEEPYSEERARDALGLIREANLFAKERSCDEETRERIYRAKHRWLARYYRHGKVTAVRTVRNEMVVPCNACGGAGRVFVPVRGVEVKCSACGGSGEAKRATDLFTSPKYQKSAYYACKVEIGGRSNIWHIRIDRAREMGIYEKDPDAIHPHKLSRKPHGA